MYRNISREAGRLSPTDYYGSMGKSWRGSRGISNPGIAGRLNLLRYPCYEGTTVS